MSDEKRLKLVLYWHMHQPQYRDLRSGQYQLPWTYLHTIKDYVDMVAHLESNEHARVVVNFAPVLLEQIDDYARLVSNYLTNHTTIRDPLLAALAAADLPSGKDARLSLIEHCLRANEKHLIEHFPAFQRLVKTGRQVRKHPHTVTDLDDRFLADLLVWYHLAWMGETVRRSDRRIRSLIDKQMAYTADDRRNLLAIIGELLSGVVSRYRKLAERGQIELSVTPYAHPIVPLLLDIETALDATPDITLPKLTRYPQGRERAVWHIRQGFETFKRFFGFEPRGCWPSEGSLSEATLRLLSHLGFRWTASSGHVLRHSLKNKALTDDSNECVPYHTYQLKQTGINCFFRDDDLSDLIGFTYSEWDAESAVTDLIHRLENIEKTCVSPQDSVVSIILDGENAWEHYPNNGYDFLSGLYRRLSSHPKLELTTYSRVLDQVRQVRTLPNLVAGSWVHGTFSTWIGTTDKTVAGIFSPPLNDALIMWSMVDDCRVSN